MVRVPSEDRHAPVNSTVVAIDKDKNSHYAVRWAVDHLLNSINNSNMILVHVRLKNPNHGGNVNNEINKLFIPYRGYCARKGISAMEVILDDTDVAKAILDYAKKNLVNNVVLGSTSSKNPFARSINKFTKSHEDVAASVLKSAPDFCSVYVISKGKVQSSRAAQRPITNTLVPPRAPTFTLQNLPDLDQDHHLPKGQRYARNTTPERYRPHDNGFINAVQERQKSAANGSLDFNYDFNQPMGQRNFDEPDFGTRMMGSIDLSAHNFDIIGSSSSSDESLSQSNRDVEAEMRRLKVELKQTMDMYSSACKEALNAKQKANELNKWKLEETLRFEEARSAEEAALAVAETEKAKCKAAMEAAEKSERMAELEGQRRKQAEMKARRESQEKDRALNALVQNDVRYRRYSIEEIEEATDGFASNRQIGEGGYGPVFKGTLDHTPVAIKVLRDNAAQGKKQFNQEVEVLSCIRHPNMVLLLGACPEYGCLVYEFMENGSLEDRLFRRGNSPPLSWRKRFQIAAEICTALSFLHQAKPEPLVHRDLKPANILLDRNYVSKISDVGLARLVPASVADTVTQYHMTSAAGTFCYIDPEYQQTGKLTTKSDVYSLGIMLLQIITAKSPMGLAHHVSRAINKGTFKDMLDPAVTDWPVEEAMTFAKLSLKCAELRKKDRPDLGKDIVPELVRLRNFGMENESGAI
ncbi:Protein kinase protein with adenine nucleotide alpha hydrolases-like domain [Raphanus sativus]|uniref:RING-type E3 ubiquitin transferase n=1 Tax=Raphanus sativus TaxID=3726 RepID=A0A6J0L6E6_RAPSA|nr:U-box domain-containing protein 52 [Raphanus sativus]KAJ4911934.1 Protein kinase protein with adenine nucleotide alpha hydrolases-like domain [Raphanus sativus]